MYIRPVIAHANFQSFLLERFNHAPWASIKRKNVEIWLAWSCFNSPLEDVLADDENKKFLEYTIELLEARTGTEFEDGYNDKVEIVRLTIDKVNVSVFLILTCDIRLSL